MAISDRIKKMRKSKGLTLEDAGKLIGVSKQTLYKYENGIITNIPSDKIENMSSVYGCSPSYIMGWDQPIPKSFTCTPEEESMIKKFRQLTPTGKQSVLAILDIQYEAVAPKIKNDKAI